MLMLDKNNLAIADLIIGWIVENVRGCDGGVFATPLGLSPPDQAVLVGSTVLPFPATKPNSRRTK